MWKVFIMFSLVPLFVVVLRLRGDLISLECPARSTLVKKASRANPTTNKSLSIATVHLHISKRRHVRRRRLKSHWNFRFINLFNHRSFSQSEFRKVSRIHISTLALGRPINLAYRETRASINFSSLSSFVQSTGPFAGMPCRRGP